jgi:hypothetical protein
LREIALGAERCSDEDLTHFGDKLALLVAGLRAQAQSKADGYAAKEDDFREKCDTLLERCHQLNPENGHPRRIASWVYADCLFRCECKS